MLKLIDREVLEKLSKRKQKSGLIKWLRDHRIPFTCDCKGHPNVVEDDFLSLYSLQRKAKKTHEQKVNVEALRHKNK